MTLIFTSFISLILAISLYAVAHTVRRQLTLNEPSPPLASLPPTKPPTPPQPPALITPQLSSPVPSPSPTALRQTTPPENNSSQENWFYPNAQRQTSPDQRLKFTSPDDPDTISNWYQARFRHLGFSAISVAKSNANNNYLYQLSAANGQQTIEISLEKQASDQLTTIWVMVISR